MFLNYKSTIANHARGLGHSVISSVKKLFMMGNFIPIIKICLKLTPVSDPDVNMSLTQGCATFFMGGPYNQFQTSSSAAGKI